MRSRGSLSDCRVICDSDNTHFGLDRIGDLSVARKMSDLRKAAKGRDCLVRLPGICNHNPETTVLAHIRRGGIAGTGYKGAGDLVAVLACSACHDAIDGRSGEPAFVKTLGGYGQGIMDSYILDALCRTLDLWTKEGLISVARKAR